MPRIEFFNNRKSNNYNFIDFHVRQMFFIGGTTAWIHKYTGPIIASSTDTEINNTGDLTQPSYAGTANETNNNNSPSESNIQDLFFQENRDRIYDPNIYEMKAHYVINDNEFNLSQFGIFNLGDNIMLSFHYNDMIAQIGRKIMAGDVIELPHLRDVDLLDPTTPGINKYYVVEDATRSAEGFDPSWWYHIWKCRMGSMQDQQEYANILSQDAQNAYGEPIDQQLENIISTYPNDIMINDAINNEADREVPFRNFENYQLYIIPQLSPDGQIVPRDTWTYPICLNFGDKQPPNGAELVGSGTSFPLDSQNGDWFLRTDYKPNMLFQKEGNVWIRREIDRRTRWKAANDLLASFINQTGSMQYQQTNTTIDKRQYLSKTLKPKPDF